MEKGRFSIDKGLSIVLIVAILGAMGTLGYVLATPRVGEKFTEFYILGLEGEAENYPEEAVVGREQTVIVGIINREHESVSYRLQVRIDGVVNNELGPLVLGHDEKWEEVVGFTPHRAGDNQKVEFLLYRGDESMLYQAPLHLWVNVKEPK